MFPHQSDLGSRVRSRYHHGMRRFVPLVFIAALLVGVVGPATAQAPGGRCTQRFGDSVFETSAAAGPVMVYGSGVAATLLDRFAADYAELAVPLQAEMGGLDDDVVVCIFDGDLPLDAQAMGWPEGQKLHAAAFGEDRMVVVSAYLIAVAQGAGRAGLLHVAMWQVSGGEYPQPFGDDVAGWYRNRIDDRVEPVHAQFVRANTGLSEPWPPFQWAAGRMVEPLLWNPEFGYGGNGDFTNFAVATAGTSILANPLGVDLATLDEGWRQGLFDESGSILGGSRGWITGLVLILAVLATGILMAWWGHVTRKRLERELREAVARERRRAVPPPVTGSVRPSGPVGERRGDARVGGGHSTTAVREHDRRDGSPPLREVGTAVDDVAPSAESGDDLFRHPGFHDER